MHGIIDEADSHSIVRYPAPRFHGHCLHCSLHFWSGTRAALAALNEDTCEIVYFMPKAIGLGPGSIDDPAICLLRCASI